MATVEQPQTGELVSLTPAAAEKIRELMAEEPADEVSVLRIAVQGGGCSGFQYALGFDAGAQEGDHSLELHGVTVVVDRFSAPYLTGSTVDFLTGLQESGFKIENPNVSGGCGCGHSFTVEDGEETSADHAGGCGSGCSH